MIRLLPLSLACLLVLPAAAAGLDPVLKRALNEQLHAQGDAKDSWHLKRENDKVTVKVLAQAQQQGHLFVLLGGEIADAAHPTPGQAAAVEYAKVGEALDFVAMSPWIDAGSFGQPQSEIESNDPLIKPVLMQYGPRAWAWRLNWGLMSQGYGTTWASLIAPLPDDSALIAQVPVAADTSGGVASGPRLVNYSVAMAFRPVAGRDFYPLALDFKGTRGGKTVPPKHWQISYDKAKKSYEAPGFLEENMSF